MSAEWNPIHVCTWEAVSRVTIYDISAHEKARAMTFNEGMQMDTGRVSTSGGGGMGGKLAMGGGAGGIVVLILTLLFGGDPGSIMGDLSGAQGQTQQEPGESLERCKDSATANTDLSCRILGTALSLDSVWEVELPNQTRVEYVKPAVQLFSGAVNTGCGQATTDVGPFYCPADQTAYFDASFFQQLVDQFGSSGGPLAQEYVVAHEVGHHIQNQLGDIGRSQSDPQGADSASVRTELQADCYAGVWAHYADTQPAPGSDRPFLAKLTDNDIRDALSAASSVGDDRIQQASRGRVNPESWTHGSSEERQKWFLTGYQSGAVDACDTFGARDLSDPGAR